MSSVALRVTFRLYQTGDVDYAIQDYWEFHGRRATLALAREGAELQGDMTLVRRTRHINVAYLGVTDETSEWGGG